MANASKLRKNRRQIQLQQKQQETATTERINHHVVQQRWAVEETRGSSSDTIQLTPKPLVLIYSLDQLKPKPASSSPATASATAPTTAAHTNE